MDKIAQTANAWKQKGLSTRASYVLAKGEISPLQLTEYKSVDELIHIKNCGSQTAQEILDFITVKSRTLREITFEDLIPK